MSRYDTTPSPYALLGMRNQAWNITGALAELVDNSFGPGRGNASTCWITYDPRTRMLAVLDNGAGMNNIGNLFRLGDTAGMSIGDIGKYGSGGTLALLWLAEAATVATLRDGMVAMDTVVWQQWIDAGQFPKIDNAWRDATVSTCPEDLLDLGEGTLIILKLAKTRGSVRIDNIKRDLARMYSPGIRAGKRIIWETLGRNGERVELSDPLALPVHDDKTVNFDFAMEYGDELLPVSGQVGLVEGVTVGESGVHVGFGSRIIAKTKDCFVSPDGSLKFSGNGVVGWLDLGDGWQQYLSTTKTAIHDRPLWEALMGYVFEVIRPLLEEADDEKLTLELQDLALSLQHVFDGAKVVAVPRPKIEVVEIPEGTGDGESDPSDDTPTEDEVDDEDAPKQDKPAKAEIQIFAVPEDQMTGGVLCEASKSLSTISVSVNKDHSIIQIALQQKPTNRMLLNQVVVSEIANVLSADEELCQMAFPKRTYGLISEAADPQQRQRVVLKVLADNIKSARSAA